MPSRLVETFNLGFDDAVRTEAATQAILREELRRADPELAKAYAEAEKQVKEENRTIEEVNDENQSEETDKQQESNEEEALEKGSLVLLRRL